jgi:integrase/recombinase XerD
MKPNGSQVVFSGTFSASLTDFVKYKRTLGRNYYGMAQMLLRFDTFTKACKVADGSTPSKQLIQEWLAPHTGEKETSRSYRVIAIREYATYMSATGVPVYVPPCLPAGKERYAPYIFTQKQLQQIFKTSWELDSNTQRKASNWHVVFPCVHMLLYCCGLRIGEAMNLKVKDVQLDRGILYIHEAKHNRERIVPVSPSVNRILKKLSLKIHGCSVPGEAFFRKIEGGAYLQQRVYRQFRKVLTLVGISHGGRGKGPRLHDFRHCFCVNALQKMIHDGKDVYSALPILSTYLGHSYPYSSEYYLHLVPEFFPEVTAVMEKTSNYILGDLYKKETKDEN